MNVLCNFGICFIFNFSTTKFTKLRLIGGGGKQICVAWIWWYRSWLGIINHFDFGQAKNNSLSQSVGMRTSQHSRSLTHPINQIQNLFTIKWATATHHILHKHKRHPSTIHRVKIIINAIHAKNRKIQKLWPELLLKLRPDMSFLSFGFATMSCVHNSYVAWDAACSTKYCSSSSH